MLPAAIPEARIFTYDWEANYFKDAPVQTLLDRADNLLTHLRAERGKTERPLIFVASCFGGLILADVSDPETAELHVANDSYRLSDERRKTIASTETS